MGVAASLSFDDSNEGSNQLLQALRKGDQQRALQLVQENPGCVATISLQEKARIMQTAVKRGHSHVLQFLRGLPGPNVAAYGASAAPTTSPPSASLSDPATQRPHSAALSSPLPEPSPQPSAPLPEQSSPTADRQPQSSPDPDISPDEDASLPPGPDGSQPSAAIPTGRSSPPSSHATQQQVQQQHRTLPQSHPHHHYHLNPHHHHHHVHPLSRSSWLNALDRRGRTPLVTAVLYNRLEWLEGLISLGADPWVGDRRCRTTAIHLASWLGHAPLVSALLRSTVPAPDPMRALYDVQDMYGFTALHYAAAAGHPGVVAVLLDAGASYTAASQLPYDPTKCPLHVSEQAGAVATVAGRVRVSAAAGIRRRLSTLSGASGGGFGGGGGGSGRLLPCAPRSNPLHLAAMRGDCAVASLVVQRYLLDTEGLTRAARDRVTDPRRQLNKDGFQPYMLAGNLGHWHVAQMLIPQARENQIPTRNRDFLIFFPLPDPAAAAAGGAEGGGGPGCGPPSLTELASRAWAAKLLADVKSAEAVVQQHQAAAAPPGTGTGAAAVPAAAHALAGVSGPAGRESNHGRAASGGLGALLRRSSKSAWVAAAAAGSLKFTTSGSLRAGGGGGGGCGGGAGGGSSAAAAAAAAPGMVVSGSSPEPSGRDLSGQGQGQRPQGGSEANTPRSSISGADPPTPRLPRMHVASGRRVSYGGTGLSAGAVLVLSGRPSDSRRGASLELVRAPPLAVPSSSTLYTRGPPSPTTPSGGLFRSPPSPTTSGGLFRFPPSPQMSHSSANLTPLCDVCFEQPSELALRPCPHRLCASCCKRVVEMHCALGVSSLAGGATAAAATARAPPGRRPTASPPRCPFCQATIRGFAAPALPPPRPSFVSLTPAASVVGMAAGAAAGGGVAAAVGPPQQQPQLQQQQQQQS